MTLVSILLFVFLFPPLLSFFTFFSPQTAMCIPVFLTCDFLLSEKLNWWWLSTLLQWGQQIIHTVAGVCTHPLWMPVCCSQCLLRIFIQFHLALPDPCLCFIWLKCKHPDICKQILKHPGILFLFRKFKSCKLKLPKLSKIMNT